MRLPPFQPTKNEEHEEETEDVNKSFDSTVATDDSSSFGLTEASSDSSFSPSRIIRTSAAESKKSPIYNHLVNVMNGLQKSMKEMMEKRAFYAQSSVELEQSLKEKAPDALSQSISMRTIQVADILMELEDLYDKVAVQEGQIQKMMQNDQAQEGNIPKGPFEQLMNRYERLKVESEQKERYLIKKITEANQESLEVQQKYSKMRRSFHGYTKNIATMATKIASVQQENHSLREQMHQKDQALFELEQKLKAFRGTTIALDDDRNESEWTPSHSVSSVLADPGQPDCLPLLELQLDAYRNRNEKLLADQKANEAVISELKSQIHHLQHSVQVKTKPQESTYTDGDDATVVTSDSEDDADSPSGQSIHVSSAQETRQLSSISPRPTKATRMKVYIDDKEGSYTGPLGENGLPHGTGTIRFRNGNTYLGEVQDGKLHGKGTMYVKGQPAVRDQQYQNNRLMV